MDFLYEKKDTDFQFRLGNGIDSFPLQCAPHLHYHIEVCLLKKGNTSVFIDSSEYKMESGDLCICFPNQIHQFVTYEPEKYRLLIVSPDMCPDLVELFVTQLPDVPIIKNAVKQGNIEYLFDRIAELSKQELAYKNILIKGCMFSLFGEIFERISLSDTKSGDSHALKSIVNYCSQNFSKELSLSILEKELHINKYYISHLFGQKLKISFNDYINSMRISDACRQLRQSDKTITEISECVGFNTLRTFNRAFIKQRGLSPSEYRKQGAYISPSSIPF